MSTASITSSAGPLDVQSLVSQLMTVADEPLNKMQSQLSTDQSQISDYGTLNSDLTALQTSLTPLSSGSFVNSLKAASSNTDVLTATSDDTANAGTYNITVNSLATAQNVAFAGQTSESSSLGNSADTLTFTFGSGSTSTVNIAADSSLSDIATAINSAGIGVSASVVQADDSSSPYRLVLTGNSVGSGESFSTSTSGGQSSLSFLTFDASSAVNSSGTITDSRLTQQAQDANLTVNGLTMVSDNNTVTSAINGVTLNLTQTGSSVLTTSLDTSTINSDVQAFVTAYNKVQSDASSLYSGDLQGNYNMVELQNTFDSILQTPISGANGTTQVAYLAQIGITISKDGSLALNTTQLDSAITNNPSAVSNLFNNTNSDGYVQRFNDTINNMLGTNGLITASTTQLNQNVSTLNTQITQEQNTLSEVQQQYLTEYSNLNSELTKMEQTSTSISAMITDSAA